MSFEDVNTLKEIKNTIYGRINKRQNGFVDCCEKYSFIRKSNIISFNNKMNYLKITHLVLDEEYDQTDVLKYDITMPVKYGAPIVIAFVGSTRSGKSEGAQLVHFLNLQANKRYKNRNVELHLCWTQVELQIALKNLKKGDIVWVDEQMKTTGEGSLKETWNIDNALHSIAKKENCFIFCTPKIKKIKSDICDLYLETAGQNRKTRINRFMILDSDKRYFGHVYLKLHNNHKFREWYEKEKDININKVSNSGGEIKHPKELEDTNNPKEDVSGFVRITEGMILTPIESLKEYLKEHNNRITAKEYSVLKNISYKMALVILKRFVDNEKLKSKKEERGLNIFYI